MSNGTNRYSKRRFIQIKSRKENMKRQIKLQEDKIKRKNELLSQMNTVLENYKKTQNLKHVSLDSNINPNYVEQGIISY